MQPEQLLPPRLGWAVPGGLHECVDSNAHMNMWRVIQSTES
jgi:hypothetical protein